MYWASKPDTDPPNIPAYALELMSTVDSIVPRLLEADNRMASLRPAPRKWSAKEIVGHLIDSASNNHQRFVRARFQDDLIFPGYEQDEWVSVQRYQEASWSELVGLWASFNRHLARYMGTVPEPARMRLYARHNLDVLAFRALPASEPATLDYFMADYVRHLHHHLTQIRSLLRI